MKSNSNIYWIMTILSVAGYAWIGFHFISKETAETCYTVCLVKNVTGVPCPSCGVTRSLLLLVDGELLQAFFMNPLGCFAAIALIAIPCWTIFDTVTQERTFAESFLWIEKKIRSKKTIYLPLVALALINWGWNILKEL